LAGNILYASGTSTLDGLSRSASSSSSTRDYTESGTLDITSEETSTPTDGPRTKTTHEQKGDNASDAWSDSDWLAGPDQTGGPQGYRDKEHSESQSSSNQASTSHSQNMTQQVAGMSFGKSLDFSDNTSISDDGSSESQSSVIRGTF